MKSLSTLSTLSIGNLGTIGQPTNLQSILSVTSFDQPTQQMPPHFLSLYEKLTTIYLNKGDDGHCEINEELNHYIQYVLFNIKEFNTKRKN